MHITPIQIIDTPKQTRTIEKEKNPHVKSYLQSINWDTTILTNQKLEAMLVASCLRFLENLEEIPFVLGLANKISTKYGNSVNLALHYSLEIVNDLATKLKASEIQSNDSKNIKEIINEAQMVITGRTYHYEFFYE